jgi:hypothetical protein
VGEKEKVKKRGEREREKVVSKAKRESFKLVHTTSQHRSSSH